MIRSERVKRLSPTSLQKALERVVDAQRALELLHNKELVPGIWLDQLANLKTELQREWERRQAL